MSPDGGLPQRITDADVERWGLTVAKQEGRFVIGGVTDVWLERALDTSWIAAYRLVASRGRLRIGEVRVFPAEPDFVRRPEGEWSGVWRGVLADAPPQGLTGRIVRAAGRVHGWAGQLDAILERLNAQLGSGRVESLLGKRFRLPIPQPKQRTTTRRGRKPKAEEFYAEIARDYVNAIRSGSPSPVQAVAEKHTAKIVRVRGWIHRARVYGFIEGGAQGKAEGQLSAKALFYLEAGKQERQPRSRRTQPKKKTIRGK